LRDMSRLGSVAKYYTSKNKAIRCTYILETQIAHFISRLKKSVSNRSLKAISLLCFLIISSGSDVSHAKFLNQKNARKRPRIRIASYATSTKGIVFLDPEHLGQHGYRHNLSEKNGIVYTCKAGHIDISHLRKFADWTGFLAAKTLQHIRKGDTIFSFKLRERSRYFVELTYPKNWDDLPLKDKERIAHDVAIALGQHFAYVSGVWHEILTWFGYRSIGLYKEFQSAFSWEDVFSDLLGTQIGAQALQDAEHEFSEAVTLALSQELEKLHVQPKSAAIHITDRVKGLWFSGDFIFVRTKGRNFDIGLDDGFVTPWLVPSVSHCEGAEPQSHPIPNLDVLSKYGFSMKLEIEPKEWEKAKILKIVYADEKAKRNRLEPALHFIPIMNYIRQEAVSKYNFLTDPSCSISEK